MQGRRWCFTFFDGETEQWNEEDPGVEWLDQWHIRFATGQRERAPTTGRLHIQGYIEFTRPVRRSHVQGALRGGRRVNCSTAREMTEECIRYCRKPETRVDSEYSFIWQRGTQGHDMVEAAINGGADRATDIRRAAGQGRRRDLSELAAALRSGFESGARQGALGVAWNENASTSMKYTNGISRYIEFLESQAARVVRVKEVVVRWGTTGTGKTESAFRDFPDLWRSLPANRGEKLWYQGYTGQAVALFDDYDGSAIPITTLLQLTDRYPMCVEYKGGSAPWMPTTIIFTSNKAPAEWYADQTPEHRNALQRRITKVYWHSSNGVVEQPEHVWKHTF